uniref:Secreted protein n=1 Tax=Stomoxys calcitrans TaxID=35570 RepID=A0A1I8PFW6_STOCA
MFGQVVFKSFFALLIAVLAITLFVRQADCKPQIEHGSVNGPSGRFQRTVDMAVPPTTHPVVVPEFTPVHEDNGEPPRQG